MDIFVTEDGHICNSMNICEFIILVSIIPAFTLVGFIGYSFKENKHRVIKFIVAIRFVLESNLMQMTEVFKVLLLLTPHMWMVISFLLLNFLFK